MSLPLRHAVVFCVSYTDQSGATRGHMSPIAISPSASYCHCDVTHSHYDVSRLWRSRPPFSVWRHSHCDVIRYWAGLAQRYGRTNVRTPCRIRYIKMWMSCRSVPAAERRGDRAGAGRDEPGVVQAQQGVLRPAGAAQRRRPRASTDREVQVLPGAAQRHL